MSSYCYCQYVMQRHIYRPTIRLWVYLTLNYTTFHTISRQSLNHWIVCERYYNSMITARPWVSRNNHKNTQINYCSVYIQLILTLIVGIYIINWNFLYVSIFVWMSVCTQKYLEKYRTYSVKTKIENVKLPARTFGFCLLPT